MSKRKNIFSTVPTNDKVAVMVERLSDKKARDILALDLTGRHGLSEAVVIASATSVRHGQGLAEHLLASAREDNFEYLSMEGHQLGQWILLDFNDVIVHIFHPESRDLFRLDDLWPDAPVLADTRGA
ncbi:MAG: ribosome silencing factor [Desulfovibrio sp.]|jgi:ribosome-associated protein|nr:ribosome silencing factor [Desulfovibrio sp.]